MPEKQQIILISVKCEAVIAEVSLNGFRIFWIASSDGRSSNMKASEWVIDGDNTISMRCGCFGTEPTPLAHFSVEVKQGPDEPIYNYTWTNTGDFTSLTPVIQEDLFSLAATGRYWAWQDAPMVEIDENVQLQVFNVVSALHQSLAAKNLASVQQQLELKNTEICRAYGISADVFSRGLENFYHEFFADPQWELRPLEYDNLMFHDQAGGKAILVTNRLNSPPISSLPDSQGRVLQLNIIVSRIDNDWKIIR